MADKITFMMILHNHQPVGNFGWVFNDAAQAAYIPFLDVLERHPGIKAGLHTTGPLLEWFDENNPDYLNRVKKLVDENRMEILGGAFYEPILSVLPDRDKNGQINMMSDWLERHFGARPSGCWVAERIWEPSFASVYANNNLSYTALDNTHFLYAGIPEDRTWGSYITEDQGKSIRVFPIDYQLRYLIPFHEPQETIDYLGTLKDRGVTGIMYADDGEKFGVWPGTAELVYKRGWLEKFFTLLEDNSDWIEQSLPGDYVKNNPPLGQVYLPTASYREMTEWALPVEAQKKLSSAEKAVENDSRFEALNSFVRGGFWRNFITKYQETGNMYRRMLRVSYRLDAAKENPNYQQALRELYMAQCNCGYWHGVFGGLYLNFLRRAIYEHLIKAERLVAERRTHVDVTDFDGDGFGEAILENDTLSLFIAPEQGGSALELDYFPSAFNLFDTMTRRPELYHDQIPDSAADEASGETSIHDGVQAKESGMRDYIRYDRYRRLNFIDHFMPEGESLGAFSDVTYNECGDFVGTPYEVMKVKEAPCPGIYLFRQGTVSMEGRHIPVSVHKQITIPQIGSVLTVSYSIEKEALKSNILFGAEMNLGLQSGNDDNSFITIPDRALEESHLASAGTEEKVLSVALTVGWMPLKVSIHFSKPATLWRFPIETVSLSEGGAERNYQNTCLVPIWTLKGKDIKFDVEITMEVERD